jgi:hypothetical protein
LGATGVSTMVETFAAAGFGAALESVTVALSVACAGSLESSCGESALLGLFKLSAETACESGLVVAALPAVTLLGSTRVMSVVTALGFALLVVLEVVLAALLLETFVSGTCVLGVAALGGFIFGTGVPGVSLVGAGLSSGAVAVVAGVLVSGVLLTALLEAELAGFGAVFVALKLGVPRKSKETKPPTTSKIRVIIKVSTQFRRHQPIGFMALLYPLSM